MQRILQRENKIDQEKEHFWIIGMNLSGYILYIELVSLGSVKATVIEPMNVFRVAILKNATRVIAVHNHPGGNLMPSENDLDNTDRLIQVGRILDIAVDDHLIITEEAYLSFRAYGVMEDLEKSLRYVPNYQIVERIRKEEQEHVRETIEKSKEDKRTLIAELLARGVSVTDIAKMLNTGIEEVETCLDLKNGSPDGAVDSAQRKPGRKKSGNKK